MKKKTASKQPAAKTVAAKKTPPKKSVAAAFEADGFWTMRLYVAGQSPKSLSAIANLRRICEQYVPGRYQVEIIDLVRNPELAKVDQIVAIPTLIKKLPIPVGRIIGDLSATDRVVVSLELTNN